MTQQQQQQQQEHEQQHQRQQRRGAVSTLLLFISLLSASFWFQRFVTTRQPLLPREHLTSKPALAAPNQQRSAPPSPAQTSSIQRERLHSPIDTAALPIENHPRSPKRLRIILHVGPAKTATTTLQTVFTEFATELQSDGIQYMGRFYQPYVNSIGKLILNRSESDLLNLFREWTKCRNRDACLLDIKRYLHEQYQYYNDTTSFSNISNTTHSNSSLPIPPLSTLLLSDESFDAWTAHDYQLLAETLQGDHDVLVMAGYRRYYEWLLSKKFQQERVDHTNRRKVIWPRNPRRGPRPFFPDWTREVFSNNITPNGPDVILPSFISPAYVARQVNASFPLVLVHGYYGDAFNLEAYTFCHALQAQHACQRAMSSTPTDTFLMTNLSSIIPSHNNNRSSLNQHNTIVLNAQDAMEADDRYYDAIAIAAAQRGLVNTSAWSRTTVREAVKHHQESTMGQSRHDLPMQCPSAAELDALLSYSLQQEQQLVPKLYATHRDEHVAGFQHKVETQAFCWVDVPAVLNMEEWIRFFETLNL